jgi:hypothetical protein
MELSNDRRGWNGGLAEMMDDVPSLMTIVSEWNGVTGRDWVEMGEGEREPTPGLVFRRELWTRHVCKAMR